ncbi:MAG: flavodoxin family protein [Candidatus Hodarchaeota archaeon]
MNKVVVIHGSHRKRNTFKLVQQIEAILQKDVKFEHIHLYDYDISWCRGCNHCILKGGCRIEDDKELIREIISKMEGAIGIIFCTPVYVYHVTARMKNFFDRTISLIHRPNSKFVAKPAFVVCTAMGSSLKSVKKYLTEVIMSYGMHPVGFVGRSAMNLDIPVKPTEIAKFRRHLYLEKSNYKPSMTQLIYYQIRKVLAMKIITTDRIYWQEKGWDKTIFYWKCRINPFKKLIAKAFYILIANRIKTQDELMMAENKYLEDISND